MSDPMRVVFFGSPEAALPSLRALGEAGHEIALVVSQPDRPSGRGKHLLSSPVKRFALDRGIPVVQPEKIRSDPGILDRLKAAAADIHVVVAYGQIIPMPVIALPRHWTINVHFSLLPRYRGAAPVAAAILAGETRTGVTIFRLNEKMDEGDVLTEAETEIVSNETAGQLEARLAELGAGLLLRTLEEIKTIIPRRQDPSRATPAPKIAKENGRIDWTRPAVEIDRRVRAMTPRPSAFTRLRGLRLIIVAGRPDEGVATAAHQAPPGTVSVFAKAGIAIACGDGSRYLITRLRPENRVEMDAHAFTLGGGILVGDFLE
ncbi:MAG: methionyl-tRNA formyltransferase [Candidatus Aminicenantales bacterium]